MFAMCDSPLSGAMTSPIGAALVVALERDEGVQAAARLATATRIGRGAEIRMG
jgi:hypothetical protein